MLSVLRLKKGEERRIQSGHPWVYSNEIDTQFSPLKTFHPGQEVIVEGFDKHPIGVAYINPHSLITARIFSRHLTDRLDLDFFKERIATAYQLRERLFKKPFYRLIFGEADGLPGLVVDRFNQTLVLQSNTAGMEPHLPTIRDALLAILPDTASILVKNDTAIREQEGLKPLVEALYGNPPDTLCLEENAVKFWIPLSKGQKTGWFYDHRLNRARLADYVLNQTVLDVFSYVGGWGIQAACHGARQVDCIDASKLACEFIAKNAEQNNVTSTINVLCMDAFDALQALQKQKKRYGVIILDPPAFIKKFKDRKEGLIAYLRLNTFALELLDDNGVLITCSCSMHLGSDDLLELIQRIAFKTKTALQILERGHQGPDHPIHPFIPETDYLKTLILRKLGK